MPPKRRRRFQGLYYHSSPPKVLPMNGQVSIQRRRRDVDDFSVKLSTIRIWMHEKDIGKLTRILWAGQGNRLRQQASTNAKVKRFLAAVPYAMNNIKDVHQAVVDNTLETLQANLEPPVPPALITCKDANGLNVIHKAAGLGHAMILEYLIGVWPDGVHETDITGKTPLHWAASCKNNMRCYTLLTQAGCDEDAQDYKLKTPSYYRHKPHEIERAFLVYVPDAPRVSSEVSTDWEAFSDDSGDGKKLDIKIPDAVTNGFHDRSSDTVSDAEVLDGENNTEDVEEAKVDEIEATPEEEKLETPLPTPPPTPPEKENEAVTEENEDHQDNDENDDNDERKLNDLNETTTETANMVEDVSEAKEKEEKEEEEEVLPSNEEKENEDNDMPEAESLNIEENNNELDGVKDKDMPEAEPLNVEENNIKLDGVEESGEDTNEEAVIENNEENQNVENDVKIESNIEISNNENPKETNENIDNKIEDTENDEIPNNKNSDEKNNEETKESLNESLNENEAETDKIPNVENNDNATDKTENAIEKENEKEGYGQTDEAAVENESNEIKIETEIEIDDKDNDNSIEVIINSETEKDELTHDDKNDNDNKENVEINVRPESTKTNKKKKKSTDSENSDDDDDEQDVVANTVNESLVNTPNDEMENDGEPEAETEIESETPLQSLKMEENFVGNHNEEKEYDVESPTSSLAIEGFVQGESEDNTVQSQSAAFVDEESRIQDIIASGDMERLAQIVLNGDGSKLLGMQTPEAEIQAFLNNVPNYMSKIRRVHEAARNGKIMELQQALDRRKFAIAKDEISPNGASPLHVAVLFGHSDIVRYLAARFPETTSITDNDGRTALHYAATIKDNGHFYNVLTQLGANPKSLDKLGHSPEYYLDPDQVKDKLTYSQLLNNFGAADLEDELLSDQGQVENNTLQTNPIFKTEQGKYLASTLAEPLIKALTEIANKRPEDPISFLSNYLQQYMRSRNTNSTDDNPRNSGKTNSTALVKSPAAASHIMRNGQLQNDNNYDLEEESADESVSPKLEDRDEHGQSMLHFASARSHRRGGLLHLIEESKIDITYRDELYRTARDVSLQANQPSNAKEIDRFVLSLAIVGDLAPFEHLVLSGYDHIIDIVNDEGVSIIDIARSKGHDELVAFLQTIRSLEEKREELHESIRENKVDHVKDLVSSSIGKWLISAKNYYGRTALHIAVLKESEEIVDYFVNMCPEALKIGDNLERTVLHYAMGTSAIETLSHIIIQKGAKRTNKDLKGRQPSYYFMNKADILRLQEEEDENR